MTLQLISMLSSPSFDYQTWRKGSLPRSWRHTGTYHSAIVASLLASSSVVFPKNLRQIPLDRHRLPSNASRRDSLTWDLSPKFRPVKAKTSTVTRMVYRRSLNDFRWYEAFFASQKKRKPRKKYLHKSGVQRWRSALLLSISTATQLASFSLMWTWIKFYPYPNW